MRALRKGVAGVSCTRLLMRLLCFMDGALLSVQLWEALLGLYTTLRASALRESLSASAPPSWRWRSRRMASITPRDSACSRTQAAGNAGPDGTPGGRSHGSKGASGADGGSVGTGLGGGGGGGGGSGGGNRSPNEMRRWPLELRDSCHAMANELLSRVLFNLGDIWSRAREPVQLRVLRDLRLEAASVPAHSRLAGE